MEELDWFEASDKWTSLLALGEGHTGDRWDQLQGAALRGRCQVSLKLKIDSNGPSRTAGGWWSSRTIKTSKPTCSSVEPSSSALSVYLPVPSLLFVQLFRSI